MILPAEREIPVKWLLLRLMTPLASSAICAIQAKEDELPNKWSCTENGYAQRGLQNESRPIKGQEYEQKLQNSNWHLATPSPVGWIETVVGDDESTINQYSASEE